MPTVLILLSDKRSGSSVFSDELCRHPQVETVRYSPHRLNETHWWLMSAVLLDMPGPLFVTGRRYDGYGTQANARALMVETLLRSAPNFAPPEDNRALVFEGWEALCRASQTSVFFEKSPQIVSQWAALTLMMEWIEGTDMTVKIVGLVRNPHGVLYSAAQLFGTAPDVRQFAWLAGCRNLLAVERMLPADMTMRLRYETLAADPPAAFAAVAAFAGVAPNAAIGAGVHAGSVEKWRRDPSYRLALHSSVRQMALALGFPADELVNPNDAPDGAHSMPRPGLARRSRIWLNRRRDRIVKPAIIRIRAALGGVTR